MGEKRNAYRLLVGKPEGKRPLGRPRRGWVDNIKIDPGEIGLGDVDWTALAQDRDKWRALVNAVMNLRAQLVVSFVELVSQCVFTFGVCVCAVSSGSKSSPHFLRLSFATVHIPVSRNTVRSDKSRTCDASTFSLLSASMADTFSPRAF
jgi:hypothetical protein